MIKSINPATEKEIQSYSEMGKDEINRIIISADKSFEQWKRTSFSQRADKMRSAGVILRKKKETLSILMTVEMGKPIVQSRSEIDKCAMVCDYFAENAERFLQDEKVETEAANSFITYQPLGVILAIMPWNFPFWQVFRFAAPNLMAGNAGVLKHSSNVTGCGLPPRAWTPWKITYAGRWPLLLKIRCSAIAKRPALIPITLKRGWNWVRLTMPGALTNRQSLPWAKSRNLPQSPARQTSISVSPPTLTETSQNPRAPLSSSPRACLWPRSITTSEWSLPAAARRRPSTISSEQFRTIPAILTITSTWE